MKLGELWAKHGGGSSTLPSGADDLYLFGVSEDSRDIRFGYLFCALPGTRDNGLAFCAQAAAKGAQAIAVPADTPDADLGLSAFEREKIVVLRVPDVRAFFARAAAEFHPGRPEAIAAVTGTNGKTSTVCFLRDLWSENGHTALSLGTLGLQARGTRLSNLEAGLTTYDAKTLHLMLDELAQTHQVTHLAMEASSHALDQQRLAGVRVDAAGFTNLTQDHLDYHPSMEAYFQAKLRLFTESLDRDGTAVVGLRDAYGLRIADAMKSRNVRVITYGEGGSAADLRVHGRRPHGAGQRLRLTVFGSEHEVDAPVAGAFQAENILCALGLALATGVSAERALAGLGRLAPVPGRLELAATLSEGAAIYVDYAHTPDALANVLRSMRPHVAAGGKLHVLFGCGGDRDPGKRVLMGGIAARLGDEVWVTDDNPRSEDPAQIRMQVLSGATGPGRATDAGPRRDALQRALAALGPRDILVVAGKGHEDYQIVRALDPSGQPVKDARGRPITVKIPFSDTRVIREIIAGY